MACLLSSGASIAWGRSGTLASSSGGVTSGCLEVVSDTTTSLWPMATDRKTLLDPVRAFMANKAEEGSSEASQLPDDSFLSSPAEGRNGAVVDSLYATVEPTGPSAGETEALDNEKELDHLPSTDDRSPSIAEIMVLRGGENEVCKNESELPHVNTTDKEYEFAKIKNEALHVDIADGEDEARKIENEPTHVNSSDEEIEVPKFENVTTLVGGADEKIAGIAGIGNAEFDSQILSVELNESSVENIKKTSSQMQVQRQESLRISDNLQLMEAMPGPFAIDIGDGSVLLPAESWDDTDLHDRIDEQMIGVDGLVDVTQSEAELSSATQDDPKYESSALDSFNKDENHSAGNFSESHFPQTAESDVIPEVVSDSHFHEKDADAEDVLIQQTTDEQFVNKEQHLSSAMIALDSDSVAELERVKMEMKMMETALQGAARQAQSKADEIARSMNENEQLKSVIEDLKRKFNEADVESLREGYHERVAALERKVYALTKERDTLRREQTRKSDAAALLKEKDAMINQVMAEGEELSKKQAAQESQIRKLRAQIREFEEEMKGLLAKLQVEENKVESIKRDKAATEKLLQETIEKYQSELSAQKQYSTNSLAVAKEAETLAEVRANNKARTELESRLREADERETMFVQELEELRRTLSRKEQQTVFREDMLHKDIEDLQKLYQASERRCEELITQVPLSTRPLLRQIEAIQETASRRSVAWAAVERSLNSRLQEAESKSAAAEERERSINERLSQTLSRINVLEAQLSCLRAEQVKLSKSLEKERERAADNRQEYLAAKEEAETHAGHARQLEVESRGLKKKHKDVLQDALANRELLQLEVEKEKSARVDLERTAHIQTSALSDQTQTAKPVSPYDNGNLARRFSSTSSPGSTEESCFLQASLDSSENLSEERYVGEMITAPYYMKHMTLSSFEATLRQKQGELESYMSRLASMEAIRDSLAEELVKMTGQCEKLQGESAMLPGLRVELEALRRRHSAALELMGERDEELEELRADIADLKDMYREQVNVLVNKIQFPSSSMSGAV